MEEEQSVQLSLAQINPEGAKKVEGRVETADSHVPGGKGQNVASALFIFGGRGQYQLFMGVKVAPGGKATVVPIVPGQPPPMLLFVLGQPPVHISVFKQHLGRGVHQPGG